MNPVKLTAQTPLLPEEEELAARRVLAHRPMPCEPGLQLLSLLTPLLLQGCCSSHRAVRGQRGALSSLPLPQLSAPACFDSCMSQVGKAFQVGCVVYLFLCTDIFFSFLIITFVQYFFQAVILLLGVSVPSRKGLEPCLSWELY